MRQYRTTAGIEDRSRRGWQVDVCRAAEGGCPNALTGLDALRRKIETLLEHSACIAPQQIPPPGQAHAHRPLRVALAACPNACTQPQIRTIGLIAAVRPLSVSSDCTGCSQCAAVCRESAINADSGVAKLDALRCVGCGHCGTVCAHGALDMSELRFRMLVGGRMGRHPRFGTELPFTLRPAEVPEAVGCVLTELVCNAGEYEPLSSVAARLESDRMCHVVEAVVGSAGR
jgi:anaerobic sulfite reductase subunit C